MNTTASTKLPALARIRQFKQQFAASPNDQSTYTRLWVALATVDQPDLLAEYPDGRIPATYEHLIALGNHAFFNGRFEEAARFYAQARSQQPEWPFAAGTLAYTLSTLGRHAEADAIFQRVAKRYAWPYGNLRLGEEFWQALQAADEPVHHVDIRFPGRDRAMGWWALISVDAGYLERYVPAMADSFLRHHGDEAGLHVHVVNPTGSSRELAQRLFQASAGRVAISTETVGVGVDQLATCERIRERRVYYASSRFLIAPQLLHRYDCPLVILDADLIVKQDLAPLVAAAGAWDVSLTRYPVNRQLLWQQYFASFQVLRPTAGGLAFATLLAKYLRDFLDRDRWIWPLDQAAQYSLGEYLRSAAGPNTPHILHQTPENVTAGTYFENFTGSMARPEKMAGTVSCDRAGHERRRTEDGC